MNGRDLTDYLNALLDARRLRRLAKYERPLVPLEFNSQNQSQPLLHWSKEPWLNEVTGEYVIKSEEIWVFPVSEVKKILAGFEDSTETILRLRMLLGLPPWVTYRYFNIFTASKGSIFRPCFDPDPTKEFPCPNSQESYALACSANLERWMNKPIRHFYPWTGLGFTYDLERSNGREGKQGVSEYVLCKNSSVRVSDRIENEGIVDFLRRPEDHVEI